ncbi:MAG: Na+/H+ antiporter subunit C [Deltaproteobacteria bacterium]|nr:MAG: Na+/H+ antiporter subunit C [Deltaproteobacteria bacterium]
MFFFLSIVVGGLFAAGLYLILRRSIVKLIFGLVLLGHAANLLIFTASGLVRARPPLIPEGDLTPGTVFADPVPQALVLTAIVISFAVIAFAAVLIKRFYRTVGSGDVDELKATDI